MVGLLMAATAISVAAAPPGAPVEEGKMIFQQACASCHTIGGGDRVGPDLKGIAKQREAAWLKVQIQSPSVLHAQNDPVVVANAQRFGMRMPDLPLADAQVDALIYFLGSEELAPAAMPTLYIPVVGVSILTLVVLTFLGLRVGAKRVEVRL
jgi:mono/diheme cytochrome c family protein